MLIKYQALGAGNTGSTHSLSLGSIWETCLKMIIFVIKHFIPPQRGIKHLTGIKPPYMTPNVLLCNAIPHNFNNSPASGFPSRSLVLFSVSHPDEPDGPL